jgi:hypothetical protein
VVGQAGTVPSAPPAMTANLQWRRPHSDDRANDSKATIGPPGWCAGHRTAAGRGRPRLGQDGPVQPTRQRGQAQDNGGPWGDRARRDRQLRET